jgi:branched-chain amino acid transport system substrate-binding protein
VITSTLVAGLAACGGSATTASGTAACSTTAPGVTATGVNLGLIYPDTGPLVSSMSAFRAGVDARLDLVNSQGGVNGRTITYTAEDDRSDPAINGQVAQTLIAQGNSFGIIEAPGATKGSIAEFAKQNIPVTGVASDTGWIDQKNMFSWLYLGEGSTTAWGDYLASLGVHRVAVIAISGSNSNGDFSRQFIASLLSSHLTIAKVFQVSDATTDYRVVAQQMKAANVDAVAGVLLPAAASTLVPYARLIGVPLKATLMPLGYDATDLHQYGPRLEGVSVFTAITPIENPSPQQQTFLQAMAKYAPEVSPPSQDSAVDGWISADLMIRGLQAAGQCPTRDTFISGLRGVTSYDNAGMAPGPENLATNYHSVSLCYAIVQYDNSGTKFDAVRNSQGGISHCGNMITSTQMDQLLGQLPAGTL